MDKKEIKVNINECNKYPRAVETIKGGYIGFHNPKPFMTAFNREAKALELIYKIFENNIFSDTNKIMEYDEKLINYIEQYLSNCGRKNPNIISIFAKSLPLLYLQCKDKYDYLNWDDFINMNMILCEIDTIKKIDGM
jgi:hypothetical protein